MAIQMRRGNAAQYDESKMVAGEFAVAVDSEELHIAFSTGESKKVLTEDDYVPQIFRNVWTGRCSTAAATATKTVTLDDDEGFNVHTAGYTIAVYFVAGNTADFPKLDVNGTGALNVKRGTSSSGASVSGIDARWGAGIQFFTYQGGYWIHSSADPVAVSNLANNKADLNSPALTGTPTAPTAVSGTDTTQIATTAFVQEAVDKQGQANIAPSFSASTAYSAGDYVIYSGKLYQFTSAHAAGAWTGADAEECTVAEKLGEGGGGIGVPNTVRQAIFTLLSKAIYTETGLTDEKAIVEDWASVSAIGIVLSEQTIFFDGEGTHQLRAILTPPDSTDEPLWSTSNANVAVVSQSGLVSTVGNGSCTISATIGSLVATCAVTVTGIATYYSISNTLTKVDNSNASEVSLEGSAYLATLTASTGYAMDAVTVTMGGVDVTSTVYADGEISISAVTGDVEITASATLKGTNLMTPVTSANWNISTHTTISNVDGNDFTFEVIDNLGLNWNAVLFQNNLTEKSSVLSGKTLFIEFDVEGLSGSTSDTDKILVGIAANDRANPTSGGQRKGYANKAAQVDGHYSLEVAVTDTSIQLSDSYYLGGFIYFYGPQGYKATIKNVVLTYY